jgi:hypothetical protein
MWIELRLPARKGFIFGFQRLVLCPKCTPASSSSSTVTIGKAGLSLRPVPGIGEACAAGTEPGEPSRRAHPAFRGWGKGRSVVAAAPLPKKRLFARGGVTTPRWDGPSALGRWVPSVPGASPQAGMGSRLRRSGDGRREPLRGGVEPSALRRSPPRASSRWRRAFGAPATAAKRRFAVASRLVIHARRTDERRLPPISTRRGTGRETRRRHDGHRAEGRRPEPIPAWAEGPGFRPPTGRGLKARPIARPAVMSGRRLLGDEHG